LPTKISIVEAQLSPFEELLSPEAKSKQRPPENKNENFSASEPKTDINT